MENPTYWLAVGGVCGRPVTSTCWGGGSQTATTEKSIVRSSISCGLRVLA